MTDDKQQAYIAEKFTIRTDDIGMVTGLIRVDALEEMRFVLADGRSWPGAEVEAVIDWNGVPKRVVHIPTGEVLWSAEAE